MDHNSVLKASYLALMMSMITACGGGGESGVEGVLDSPGNNNESSENGEVRALEKVPAATFDSEEVVVLLAPGSLMDETFLSLTRFAINLNLVLGVDITGADREVQGRVCEGGGEFVVTHRSDQDVASPFSGALHDVVESEDRGCFSSDTVVGAGRADGVRRIGHPVSGIGSGNFLSEMDFIAFEQSGESLESPFSVLQSFEDQTLTSSRYWYGFMHLRRESEDQVYGSTGGALEHYTVTGITIVNSDVSGTATEQFGSDEQDRFWLEYDTNDAVSFENEHIERYRGRYGLFSAELAELMDSCPQGSFHVETIQDLHVQQVQEGEGDRLLDRLDQIETGSLRMIDDFGNQAVVNYNAGAKILTVTLNENAPKTFTYNQIATLTNQRCGG